MKRRLIVVLAAALLGLAALQGFAADEYYIATVAGNGKQGYSGDGGPATQAMLDFRGGYDLCVDDSGVLYIAEGGNNRIRKVDTSGIITTVAGNGKAGFSGDGGPATKASLNQPAGIDVDRAGNLYIGDWGNSRIRKIGTSGIITTIAGNGRQGYAGDGGRATEAEADGRPRIDEQGNLYICQMYAIRRVDRVSGIITTIAGIGEPGCSGDGGPAIKATVTTRGYLSLDRRGNLYISDWDNRRIRKVDTSGFITTVAGGGSKFDDGVPATEELLVGPLGVCVDAEGNMIIAELSADRIRRVDTKGIIWTIAGTAARSGYSGDGGPALEAKLKNPHNPCVTADGTVYFIDGGNSVVRKLYRK